MWYCNLPVHSVCRSACAVYLLLQIHMLDCFIAVLQLPVVASIMAINTFALYTIYVCQKTHL